MEEEKKKSPRQQRRSLSNSTFTTWDCDSALYDSFELRSFEKQLYSAINSRTLSMPHLPERRVAPAPTQPPSSKTTHHNDSAPEAANYNKRHATGSSKISNSVLRFLKLVFVKVRPSNKHKSSNRGGAYLRAAAAKDQENGRYFVYDKTGALCTIPEGPESDLTLSSSPDTNSLVKRSASERFTAATAIGISCA